jgi:hypothetical protein
MLHEGVRALHKGLHCLLAFRRHDVALGPEYLLHRWSQRLDKEVGRWTARYVLTSAERPDGFYHESNTTSVLRA